MEARWQGNPSRDDARLRHSPGDVIDYGYYDYDSYREEYDYNQNHYYYYEAFRVGFMISRCAGSSRSSGRTSFRAQVFFYLFKGFWGVLGFIRYRKPSKP